LDRAIHKENIKVPDKCGEHLEILLRYLYYKHIRYLIKTGEMNNGESNE